MGIGIGVLATQYLWVGAVEGTTLGAVRMYPDPSESRIDLKTLHAGDMLARIREMTVAVSQGRKVEWVGAGFPGIVRNGVIEESPNLGQLKGLHVTDLLAAELKSEGMDVPVVALNDADAIAAGIAATRGALEKLIRVWYLGDGIGFGRYPLGDGVWEAGHSVVTLDPKERYCGCGGVGHLEGIMGNRAIRLRFLDLEPEEVFLAARNNEDRAVGFVRLWHRALAAATASFIHLAGPGRFYFTGKNVGFLELSLLRTHLETMVRMSPLQSFWLEILPPDDETALIGAGVSALRAVRQGLGNRE